MRHDTTILHSAPGQGLLNFPPAAAPAADAVARSEQRAARTRRAPAFNGAVFRNPTPTPVFIDRPGATLRRFFFERRQRVPSAPLPLQRPDPAALQRSDTDGVRVTWFGHSSVLIAIDGCRVLCDPVWAERASPVSFAGPRRFHPPVIPLEDIPTPDVVIISHDHYDHLDARAVRALAARGCRFVAPLGVGAVLERCGVDGPRITECDWWERVDVIPGALTLVATPARHFSGRGLRDRNRRLWASWAVIGRAHRVYFGADGGFDPLFADIGARLGPFDLTMLEIGAFDPAWAHIHLGPENAVRAQALLRGRLLLPIHWGTFNLALHDWFDPPEQLLAAAQAAGVEVRIPRIGGTVDIDDPDVPDHWWRAFMPRL